VADEGGWFVDLFVSLSCEEEDEADSRKGTKDRLRQINIWEEKEGWEEGMHLTGCEGGTVMRGARYQ
jgi:hypothetical protein